jgi:hypothetical protein
MEGRDVGELNKIQEVVAMAALPEGITKLVREADSKADEIFSLRIRVADFYLHNRWFLPVESETDGKEVPVRQRMDRVLERVDGGESISDIINWKNGRVPEPKAPLDKLLVMTSFRTALEAQRKLSFWKVVSLIKIIIVINMVVLLSPRLNWMYFKHNWRMLKQCLMKWFRSHLEVN